MLHRLLFTIPLLLSFSKSTFASETSVFKLTVNTMPSSFDPQLQKNLNSSFVTQQLYRGLLRYENNKGLKSEIAKNCNYNKAKIICEINKDAKFSNGETIESKHFLNTLTFLLNPKNQAPQAEAAFLIKNARAIYEGLKKIDDLGFKVLSPNKFEIELESVNFDFLYRLTSVVFSPRWSLDSESNKGVYSGPYKVKEVSKNQKVRLIKNSYYQRGLNSRPEEIEFLVIEEDSVSLKLYQKNELHFLRRLPTAYIPQYKNKPDFHWIPSARMDYFGFGRSLQDYPELRKDLAESLNYNELKNIFNSEGTPGCFGLSSKLYKKNQAFDGCHHQKITSPKQKHFTSAPEIELIFSALGGDDHKRATDWMQNQWRMNLGLKITTKGIENKAYLDIVKKDSAAIFRKGLALESPTCLAGLEHFESSPYNESIIQIKDVEFSKTIKALRETPNSKLKIDLCTKGLELLMGSYRIIPTGPIQFSMLAKPEYSGWTWNELNQLDLAELKKNTKTGP